MDKLNVISAKCIACGKCYLSYPKVFDCDDEAIAFVKESSTPSDHTASIKAIYECPTRAIELIEHQKL